MTTPALSAPSTRPSSVPLGPALRQLTLAESRRLTREPMFLMGTVGFPVLFYALFGLPREGLPAASQITLLNLAAFSLVSLSLFSSGAHVAAECTGGWLRLLRTSPVRLPTYIAQGAGKGFPGGHLTGGPAGHEAAAQLAGGVPQRPRHGAAQPLSPEVRVDDQPGVGGVQVLGQAVAQAAPGHGPVAVPHGEVPHRLAGRDVGQAQRLQFGVQGRVVRQGEGVAVGEELAYGEPLLMACGGWIERLNGQAGRGERGHVHSVRREGHRSMRQTAHAGLGRSAGSRLGARPVPPSAPRWPTGRNHEIRRRL